MIKPVMVHFDDLDAVGLLHNARYAVLLERAISLFWLAEGLSYKDVVDVVREFTITFHRPVRDMGEIAVEFWIERIGNSSAVFDFRFISTDTDRTPGGSRERSPATILYAEGRRVMVNIDIETGRPAPWSEAARSCLKLLTT